MIFGELIDLVKAVLSSWQVITVTIAVILYISLVSFVARMYHRRGAAKTSARSKKKKEAASMPVVPVETSGHEDDSNDELGLEE